MMSEKIENLYRDVPNAYSNATDYTWTTQTCRLANYKTVIKYKSQGSNIHMHDIKMVGHDDRSLEKEVLVRDR